MSDLEGKTIGISSFGSDTDIAIGIRLTPPIPNIAELGQTSQPTEEVYEIFAVRENADKRLTG